MPNGPQDLRQRALAQAQAVPAPTPDVPTQAIAGVLENLVSRLPSDPVEVPTPGVLQPFMPDVSFYNMMLPSPQSMARLFVPTTPQDVALEGMLGGLGGALRPMRRAVAPVREQPALRATGQVVSQAPPAPRASRAAAAAPSLAPPGAVRPGLPGRPERLGLPSPDSAIIGYHGSGAGRPFRRFRSDFVGSGEGTQMEGFGLYVGQARGTGGAYWTMRLSDAASSGKIPEVAAVALENAARAEGRFLNKTIPEIKQEALRSLRASKVDAQKYEMMFDLQEIEEAIDYLETGALPAQLMEVRIRAPKEAFLDLETPLRNQPREIQRKVRTALGESVPEESLLDMTGADVRDALEIQFGRSPQRQMLENSKIGSPAHKASEALREAGIPGSKYVDSGSKDYTVWVGGQPGIPGLAEYGDPMRSVQAEAFDRLQQAAEKWGDMVDEGLADMDDIAAEALSSFDDEIAYLERKSTPEMDANIARLEEWMGRSPSQRLPLDAAGKERRLQIIDMQLDMIHSWAEMGISPREITHNFVIFDPDIIQTLKINDEAVPPGLLMALIAAGGSYAGFHPARPMEEGEL